MNDRRTKFNVNYKAFSIFPSYPRTTQEIEKNTIFDVLYFRPISVLRVTARNCSDGHFSPKKVLTQKKKEKIYY